MNEVIKKRLEFVEKMKAHKANSDLLKKEKDDTNFQLGSVECCLTCDNNTGKYNDYCDVMMMEIESPNICELWKEIEKEHKPTMATTTNNEA